MWNITFSVLIPEDHISIIGKVKTGYVLSMSTVFSTESRVEREIKFVDKETSKSILSTNIYFLIHDDLHYSVDLKTKYVSPRKFSDLPKEQTDFYNKKVKVTVHQAAEINFCTKMQKEEEWMVHRKKIITASYAYSHSSLNVFLCSFLSDTF